MHRYSAFQQRCSQEVTSACAFETQRQLAALHRLLQATTQGLLKIVKLSTYVMLKLIFSALLSLQILVVNSTHCKPDAS